MAAGRCTDFRSITELPIVTTAIIGSIHTLVVRTSIIGAGNSIIAGRSSSRDTSSGDANLFAIAKIAIGAAAVLSQERDGEGGGGYQFNVSTRHRVNIAIKEAKCRQKCKDLNIVTHSESERHCGSGSTGVLVPPSQTQHAMLAVTPLLA